MDMDSIWDARRKGITVKLAATAFRSSRTNPALGWPTASKATRPRPSR